MNPTLSGPGWSSSYANEMGHIGFGNADLNNPPSLAPNFPYMYAGSIAIAGTSGARQSMSIRTEPGGKSFLVSQILADVYATSDPTTAIDFRKIHVQIAVTDRRWSNGFVPLTFYVAHVGNPNGPRTMRDYVKPGDVIQMDFINYSGTASTIWMGFGGHRYQK